ncbi:MAG: hypothetical protein Q9221_002172 [Calogaya cf. arnoldii]
MSRTVADATRFTATSPHAYSRPSSILRTAANTFSPSASPSQTSRRTPNLHIPNPPPPSQNQPPPETPQQKVARIRALRAAQKLNSLTLWDKVVISGRRYADVAHRVTVTFLMGCTVVAFFVTAFSLTDMIIYNRQQKALFIATQTAIYEQTLQAAIAAEQAGNPLTEEEQMVLNRERMVLKAEAEKEERKKKGWGISATLFGTAGADMGAEEGKVLGEKEKVLGNAEVEGRESVVGLVEQDGVKGAVKDVAATIGGQGRVMAAFQEKKREARNVDQPSTPFSLADAGGIYPKSTKVDYIIRHRAKVITSLPPNPPPQTEIASPEEGQTRE